MKLASRNLLSKTSKAFTLFWLLASAGLCTNSACAAPAPSSGSNSLRLLPLQNVGIQDNFWAPRHKIYREKTIPHSWFYMQWELRALQKALGQQVQGDLNGTWGEANLYKFLETVAYSLALQRDPELERRTDDVIAKIARAQQKDGYAHVFVINSKKEPWDPAFLDGSHDGYVLGHLIEAAIEYHAATGKRALLDVACRAADQAWQHFLGPNGKPGFCGHAELEMALAELYRVTKEPRYLQLSRAFVEWRGHGKVKPCGETPRAYFQDEVPFREQRTLEGHAVRAIFFATGVADLALENGDGDYRLAAHRFWDSTVRRMTITGSVGPRKEHEAFGEDYELPNSGYYESCAACGLADLAQRMFLLERRAEAADILERVLYNAVLHGISLDGTNTYYQNPLTDRDHLRDNCWVCCPPNLSRTLLQAGRYAYAFNERELYVNLFIGGSCRVPFAAGEVTLKVKTDYPWNGVVQITVDSAKAAHFALKLRKPGWCEKLSAKLNGQVLSIPKPLERGYISLNREWKQGDTVELALDMPVQRMIAHPAIESCRNKVALQRGPFTYGLEGLDNAGGPLVTLGTDPQFQTEFRADFLGGVTVVKGVSADNKPFLAVPFYTLANRGKSSQEVWVNQRGLSPDDSWWAGRLYRPLDPRRLK